MPDPEGKLSTPVAFDASDDPRSLTVDADDNLNVNIDDQAGDVDVNIAAQDADVEIVQQNPADLLAGIHGYIGGAWQKNPLLLGYSARIVESNDTTSDGTSPTSVLSTPVPAGEIHVVSAVSVLHNDPIARSLAIFAHAPGEEILQAYRSGIAVWIPLLITHDLVLSTGDYMIGRATSLANTKIVYLYLWGRRIDIDL